MITPRIPSSVAKYYVCVIEIRQIITWLISFRVINPFVQYPSLLFASFRSTFTSNQLVHLLTHRQTLVVGWLDSVWSDHHHHHHRGGLCQQLFALYSNCWKLCLFGGRLEAPSKFLKSTVLRPRCTVLWIHRQWSFSACKSEQYRQVWPSAEQTGDIVIANFWHNNLHRRCLSLLPLF